MDNWVEATFGDLQVGDVFQDTRNGVVTYEKVAETNAIPGNMKTAFNAVSIGGSNEYELDAVATVNYFCDTTTVSVRSSLPRKDIDLDDICHFFRQHEIMQFSRDDYLEERHCWHIYYNDGREVQKYYGRPIVSY